MDSHNSIVARYICSPKKLLLLALTYHICSLYNRKFITAGQEAGGRKNEIFIRLIELIEK